MKFLLVCAMVLISASAKAQERADTDPNANGAPNSGDLNLGGSSPLVTDQVSPVNQPASTEPPALIPETQPIQTPASEPELTPVSTTTEVPLHTINSDIWELIEKVASGSQTIPMGFVRMEVARLNRRLYNTFDYKLVLLSDCPELKCEDLGTFVLTTAEKVTKGMSLEDAINDGVLRMRKRLLKQFGLTVVSKNHVCQNPTSS
ncbi:hypothetical protein QAD02_001522 [Eretmocerus hayati]|uniref:Uncharacterized protein n=1 Tax=Eretmocerus hayati TaxID=131215 RepID=A0ACC2NHI3_9HYME|nr:hypothetical protein QAD02_001522 [Eretmocerus hayati]